MNEETAREVFLKNRLIIDLLEAFLQENENKKFIEASLQLASEIRRAIGFTIYDINELRKYDKEISQKYNL